MSGLWRNRDDTREGKYLVARRDGSVPEWPYFVLGARDPAAPAALIAYAAQAERLGLDHEYVTDLRQLAAEFERFASEHGYGKPDAPPDRIDDMETVQRMREGTKI
jgi:hypothetical protein